MNNYYSLKFFSFIEVVKIIIHKGAHQKYRLFVGICQEMTNWHPNEQKEFSVPAKFVTCDKENDDILET